MNESSNGNRKGLRGRKQPNFVLPVDEPAASAAREAIRTAAGAMASYRAAAMAGDAEAVHQMRIAMRRLRVTIELFADVLDDAWVNDVRRDLKWLGGIIGKLRDCDVIGQLIERRSPRLAVQAAAGIEPIVEALFVRRRESLDAMRRALESKRHQSLLDRIVLAPSNGSVVVDSVGAAAAELIAPLARRVARTGAKLKAESEHGVFHKLRIRIKRLRYSFEMLAEAGDGEAKAAAKALRRLQSHLGEQHDAAMAAQWLGELAVAPGSPRTALVTAGALIQSLDRRTRKLAARCCRRWRRLDRDGFIEMALKQIAHCADRSGRRETHTVDAS